MGGEHDEAVDGAIADLEDEVIPRAIVATRGTEPFPRKPATRTRDGAYVVIAAVGIALCVAGAAMAPGLIVGGVILVTLGVGLRPRR